MAVDGTWMKRPSTGVILVVAALTANRHLVQLGLAWVKGENEVAYSTLFRSRSFPMRGRG
jgi:hypothetical protein